MSTLVFLRIESQARRKKDQKRGAKTQDDQQAIRQQRLIYQNRLRRNKRDQILEERRHVMESLNWTVAWNDDEDDREEETCPEVSPEQLVQAVIQLTSACLNTPSWSSPCSQPYPAQPDYDGLSACLDVARKCLSCEMKSKFGDVIVLKQWKPGPIASLILNTDAFVLLIKLLTRSASNAIPACFNLMICREVTAILKDVIRFIDPPEQIAKFSPLILPSLAHILQTGFDLVCYTDSFVLLSHLLPFTHLQDSDIQSLAFATRSHLHRAVDVYGPEDSMIVSYIQSITQFMATLLDRVYEVKRTEDGCVMDQLLAQHFSLTELQRLLSLNDKDVTINVLNLLVTLTKTVYGSRLVANSSSEVVPLVLFLMDKRQHLNIVLEIITNLLQKEETFARQTVTSQFIGQLSAILCDSISAQEYLLTRMIGLICRMGREYITLLLKSSILQQINNMLYFGEGKTQREVVEVLAVIAKNGSEEHICTVFDSELLDALEGVLTGDLETAHRTMQTLDLIFSRPHRSAAIHLIIERVSEKLHEPIDRLFECENPDVSSLAAALLDQFP